jgi:hypothetical protein
MPNYYISGSDLPRQIKSHRSWQRGVGGRTVDIYTGLEADIITRIGTSGTPTAAPTGWKALYDEIQLTPDENSPLVRAELIFNEPEPEVTWEIIPTRVEVDILSTPTAYSLINQIYIEFDEDGLPTGQTTTVLKQLRKIAEDASEFDFGFGPDTVPAGNADIWNTANDLGNLIIAGQRGVPRFLPVLRLNQTVASRYDQKLSLTFVGAVQSTATLFAAEGVPADVLFNVPEDPPERYGFRWGWLKGAPSIRRTGRGFFSINQDWEYGEFPTLPGQRLDENGAPVGPPPLFTFVPPFVPPVVP